MTLYKDSNEITLAEHLCRLKTPEMRHELEEFRITYEEAFGKTDLIKRYTSTWPSEEQQWLLQTHPKRYWDGLPPFVQAYFTKYLVSQNEAPCWTSYQKICGALIALGKGKWMLTERKEMA